MNEYLEKLKDPRWQKVRLRVFERDKFRCGCCQAEDKTLHVHHLVYSKGEPWEAPIATLETLCMDCHEWREEFNRLMGQRTRTLTRTCYMLARLAVIWRNEPGEELGIIAKERANDFKYLAEFSIAPTSVTKGNP